MKTFAVIDTNVIVSAMLTHNQESPTRCISGYWELATLPG